MLQLYGLSQATPDSHSTRLGQYVTPQKIQKWKIFETWGQLICIFGPDKFLITYLSEFIILSKFNRNITEIYQNL